MRTPRRRRTWRRRIARLGFGGRVPRHHPRQLDMPLGEISRAVERSPLAGRLIWFLIVAGLFVIQVSITRETTSVKPDLVLLAVIFAGLQRGPGSAAVTGFAAGIVQDIHSLTLLGTHSFTNVVVGALVGVIARQFYRERFAFQIIVALFATAAAQLLFLGMVLLTRQHLPGTGTVASDVARIALYNAVLAPLVFAGARRLTGWS